MSELTRDSGRPTRLPHSRRQPEPSLDLNDRVLQPKMRVAGGTIYDEDNWPGHIDFSLTKDMLRSNDLYTVMSLADLQTLAGGAAAPMLGPFRYVIGEQHHASRFDTIKAQWPGVPTMEEGNHTVRETGLKLPAGGGTGQTTFDDSMRSANTPVLPLENYHAASLARLIMYLVIWQNAFLVPPPPDAENYLKARARDLLNLFFTYRNVATAVFIRGMDDQRFYQFGANYAGPIEKHYGSIYHLLTQHALVPPCLQQLDAAGNGPVPVIDQASRDAVEAWLHAMIPSVKALLDLTVAGHADRSAIAQETSALVAATRPSQGRIGMQAGLGLANPTRERFMREQIATLPKPALVKVGRAHVPGLTGNPQDKTYDDWTLFDADITKAL